MTTYTEVNPISSKSVTSLLRLYSLQILGNNMFVYPPPHHLHLRTVDP